MIKSKERISKFGEVFTSQREVNAMLDLVYEETLRIDSRFLEPACGDGNFLIEVVKRKILVVEAKYSNHQPDFERYAFLALSSVYGIDLLEDNIVECRERLLSHALDVYERNFPSSQCIKFKSALKFVLSKNILIGDALTLTLQNMTNPIIFSEWNLVSGNKVKRIDYTLTNLIAYQPFEGDSLFSDLGESAFIPAPLKSFPIVHYKELQNVK